MSGRGANERSADERDDHKQRWPDVFQSAAGLFQSAAGNNQPKPMSNNIINYKMNDYNADIYYNEGFNH